MATQTRSSGLFSGLVLLSVGVLLLLHNYGRLDLTGFFGHWWPLIIIFWGAVKLYERTAGRRFGGGEGGAITGGEVLLVVGMLALLGAVVGWDIFTTKVGGKIDLGENYSYDVDVAPRKIPANARVLVHNGRGDITVHGSEDGELRVTAKKSARSWTESEAERMAKPVSVEIAQNGDGFEVRPSGYDLSDSRISVELEISVPEKCLLSVKTDRGDVTISGISADVSVSDANGDVDVRGTKGDVNVEMRKGDVSVSDTQGDVKVSGKGGDVQVNDTSGSLDRGWRFLRVGARGQGGKGRAVYFDENGFDDGVSRGASGSGHRQPGHGGCAGKSECADARCGNQPGKSRRESEY